MANKSLGKVVPGGTPVRATANQADPTAAVWAHSYIVEQVPGNTAKGYVGASSGMSRATLSGVLAILPPPTANIYPSFSSTVSIQQNAFNMAEVYLDSDSATEGMLVSFIEA